mgnify:CR=1 FL=1
MLGYGNAESNQFNNQSATAVLAMRKACKKHYVYNRKTAALMQAVKIRLEECPIWIRSS